MYIDYHVIIVCSGVGKVYRGAFITLLFSCICFLVKILHHGPIHIMFLLHCVCVCVRVRVRMHVLQGHC